MSWTASSSSSSSSKESPVLWKIKIKLHRIYYATFEEQLCPKSRVALDRQKPLALTRIKCTSHNIKVMDNFHTTDLVSIWNSHPDLYRSISTQWEMRSILCRPPSVSHNFLPRPLVQAVFTQSTEFLFYPMDQNSQALILRSKHTPILKSRTYISTED